MSDPYTKAEIVDQLRQVQQGVSDTVQHIPPARCEQGTADAWSPENYLKHLLLAVKPFAKGLTYPPAQIETMFGKPDHASRTYAEIVTVYKGRLDDGIRAEDYPVVVPFTYRMPEGVTDVQAYLIESWNDTHTRLFAALENWRESDLDTHQFSHAALGMLTVREVLFFTIFHNNLHWGDIRAVSA